MNEFTVPPKDYRVIRQSDPDWRFRGDQFTMVPRAGLEISELCPENMKLMIHRALAEGYIKLIAYVPEKEYMWEKLQS